MAASGVPQESRQTTTMGRATQQLPTLNLEHFATSGDLWGVQVVGVGGQPGESFLQVPYIAFPGVPMDRPSATLEDSAQVPVEDELNFSKGSDADPIRGLDTMGRFWQASDPFRATTTGLYEQGSASETRHFDRPITAPHQELMCRLDEFREMENGWLGSGSGIAPRDDHLTWLAQMVSEHFPPNLPMPHTYPTPDGNIEMEWGIGNYCMILEINLTLRSARLFRFVDDSNDDDVETLTIDLDSAPAWKLITDSISTLAV